MRSDQWKRKRERYFKLKGRYCRACLTRAGTLEVHHLSYDRLKRERLSDLVALCKPCHREVHKIHRKSGRRYHIKDVTVKYIKSKRSKGK